MAPELPRLLKEATQASASLSWARRLKERSAYPAEAQLGVLTR